MAQLVASLQFAPEATPREGQEPGFTVRATAGEVAVLDGDPALLPRPVSYETEVTMTGEGTFVEKGTLAAGGRSFTIENVGEGVMEPSVQAGVVQGAVLWRVEGSSSSGRVSGLLATTFMLEPDTGRSVENQVLRLFTA